MTATITANATTGRTATPRTAPKTSPAPSPGRRAPRLEAASDPLGRMSLSRTRRRDPREDLARLGLVYPGDAGDTSGGR